MSKHTHFDPVYANGFIDHEHLHSGPHQHRMAKMADGRVVEVVVKGPGNYAPARKGSDE